MGDDDIGRYRNDASDTMYAGAVAVGPKLKSMRDRVMEIFRRHHPAGITDLELVNEYSSLYGACIYRSVGTRRRELVMKGLIRDSGRRKMGVAGVHNIIWELVTDAR
jgi:hypothetical protein